MRRNGRAAYDCGMTRDRIRFEVAAASSGGDADDDFDPVAGELQVRIFCVPGDGDRDEELELTARGAGLGMGPFSLILPENRLAATHEPRTVPIARCVCGTYGCGMTDAVIVRDGDAVRWDWVHEAPMERAVVFDAAQYDAEVARVGADRSWERPKDVAARRMFELVDHERLAAFGMRIEFSEPQWDRPDRYLLCLRLAETDEHQYQVFVAVPWSEDDPERTALAAQRALARPPEEWTARYSRIMKRAPRHPALAGPTWIEGLS